MNILVSGAGIAGCTASYWLAAAGHRVTVVERSVGQRSSGAPIDVHGPALAVAEKMGVSARLREAATRVEGMAFVDASGQRAVRVDTVALDPGRGNIELPRADLATILQSASEERVAFVFGDSVTALEPDADGVGVHFERRAAERFDLVVGADGLHSTVRRLSFGPEADLVRYMGLHVATVPLAFDAGKDIVMFNAPGRSVTIHPCRGRAMAAFIFWSPELLDFDHRDGAQHRRILEGVFGNDGWRVPELLEAARRTDDLYFDAVCAVDLPRWSKGRVVLLGDAASCVSLFGDGSTLAMAGGFTLAEALAEHPGDVDAGLAAYEAKHRLLVDPRMKRMTLGASLLVPETWLGIGARNLALHLWPVVAAARRVGRAFARRR